MFFCFRKDIKTKAFRFQKTKFQEYSPFPGALGLFAVRQFVAKNEKKT